MKSKNLFLAIATAVLLLSNGAFMNAQVTVGSDKTPESFSILELVSSTHNGMRLPQMTTEQRDNMADAVFQASVEAWGLQIFNTTTHCVETWNGSAWITQCAYTSLDCVDVPDQPSAITGNIVITKNTAGLIYSVNYVEGVTYAWTIPSDWAITSTSGNGSSITVTAGIASGKITVTPSNACGEGTASILNVNVGCIVQSTLTAPPYNGYVTFMCYNLGASENVQSMTPVEQANWTTPDDNYGDLYQWGRQTDGHQLRSNTIANGGVVNGGGGARNIPYDSNSQIPVGDDWYGKFVYFTGGIRDWHGNDATSTKVYRNDALWNIGSESSPKKAGGDPCPDGWRVPTQIELLSIFKNDADFGNSYPPSDATTNTWTWNTSGTPGCLIKPSGSSEATLFLPAAGERVGTTNDFMYVGANGYYWNSYTNSSYSYVFFEGGNGTPSVVVNPLYFVSRAYALSVRCVVE
ncbi:MAG: fibrobacter succinogenes major paralogous domain-containing protein [Paludibacter sp.]|nr:fibrobacter succinogenes major paralogous domain-containing protein [Paludibacter sp.]